MVVPEEIVIIFLLVLAVTIMQLLFFTGVSRRGFAVAGYKGKTTKSNSFFLGYRGGVIQLPVTKKSYQNVVTIFFVVIEVGLFSYWLAIMRIKMQLLLFSLLSRWVCLVFVYQHVFP